MKNSFQNTGKLVRFILRRERMSSSMWIVLLGGFSVLLAPMLGTMFDEQARQALVLTVNNPAMIGMLGPVYGMENYTQGAMYFNMMVQWIMITAAIMNILLVVRHTRSDEERGRVDMVRSLPVGRLSNLTAVMLVTVAVNVLMALVTGVGIAAFGIESMDLNGSMLYSFAVCAVGLVFAAITAVFAQMCSTSRGAIGFSIIALGVLYLLRGAGDVELDTGKEVLSLISPLGLAQRTQAYVENNWWPIFVLLAEAFVITLVAFCLNSIRDIRQGLLPARRGRETAHAYLRSPYGLAYRLLKMPFYGWILGMYIIGAAYGSILGTIDTFVQNSAFYSMVIGASPDFSTAEMFASMVTYIMALCAVVPVWMMILKLRSEEKEGYYENVLSRAVSKGHYMFSYLLMAMVTGILIPCASALGIYSAAVVVLPDPGMLTLGYLMKANMVYIPALLVMLGIASLIIGFLPRMTSIIWVYFGFTFFVTFLGRLPDLMPEWVVKLTPFGYIPNLPIEKFDAANLGILLIMSGIALGMMAAGVRGFGKRDIVTG